MKRILTLFLAVCVVGIFSARAQVVNFTGYYFQDFDSLANSGTGSTLPYGWHFAEKGANANTTYTAGTGSGTGGDTYSFGPASSSDRALGSQASNNLQSIFGVAFKNNTGGDITSLNIAYVVEQWRIGNTGTTRLDTSFAELSAAALDISTGLWTKVPQLNLYSTVGTATTAGALDGNNSANRTLVTYTVTGFTIPNGTTVWLRWSDINITGSDDALAIDSFTLEIPAPAAPMVGFANTSATVEEGDSVQVTLSIDNANTNATTVKVDVLSASTATVNDDYIYTGTSYTFAANSSRDTSFWIKTVDDAIVEKTETLRLMITDPTNGAMLGDSVYVLTILDNDTTQTYKIREAKFPQTAGIPDTTRYGFFHAVVTTPDFRADGGIQFAIEDSTGAIVVMNAANDLGYTVTMGDSLIVRGKVSSSMFQTYIMADSIWVKNSGNTIPAPTVITSALNDNLESDLVTVRNLRLTNPAQWNPTTGSGGFMVTATNGSRTYDIFVHENTSLFNAAAPGFLFDVTGIVTQQGTTATNGYAILPRFANDLVEQSYPLYNIGDLKTVNANGVPDSINVRAWIKGIVQSPTYRSNALEFSLQDSTGGIIVFHSTKTFGYTPNVGDSVMVLGGIVNFNGLTELTLLNNDTLIVLSTGGFPIAAKTVTKFTEENEGSLIRLENVTIINPAQWTGTGSGFNVDITNGADTFIMRIDNNVDLYTAAAPTGRFNVSGILTQFDNSAPHTTGYQLLPRTTNDIELIVIPEPVYMEYTIAQLKPYNATTGIADSIGVKAWIRGVVHSQSFDGEYFSLVDATAGISVMDEFAGYTATRGDSIHVLGTIQQMDGLTVIVPDSIVRLNTGNTLMGATVITEATEANESKLVQVNNVRYAGRNSDLILFANGTDTFSVWVANNVVLQNIDTATRVNIRGILSQMDETSPYLDGYAILPRDSFDIDVLVGIKEFAKNALSFNVYPNPTSSVVNIASDFVADRIMITDVAGKEVMRTIPVTNSVRMDVSDLKAGMYFIQVQKGGNITTKKLYKH